MRCVTFTVDANISGQQLRKIPVQIMHISQTVLLPSHIVLQSENFVPWSRDVDGEFNLIPHVRTTIIVANGFCSKNAIGIYDLLSIVSLKFCS